MSEDLVLLAGGDIGPLFEPSEQFAELIADTLRSADVVVGQSERTYSSKGTKPDWRIGPGGTHSRLHPRQAGIFDAASVNVVSMASNHAMDWGAEALLDTVEMFEAKGKQVIGAGGDEQRARKPAIVEKDGKRVGILAYCSVLRDGQAASGERPGIAPLRARTAWIQDDYQPGSPPLIKTTAFAEDIAAMQADVAQLKQSVDCVVLTIHWGMRLVPKTVCDYQVEIAHAAIDAGADVIIGHHPHSIKAVEVYRGKPCFYSVGNLFANGAPRKPESFKEWGFLWFDVDPECTLPDSMYRLPGFCRMTMLAKVAIRPDGDVAVSFLPAYINRFGQPAVLDADDPKFTEVIEYAESMSNEVPHRFDIVDNEVVISAPSESE